MSNLIKVPEMWLPVKGHDRYFISNWGRVYTDKHKKIMVGGNSRGYKTVTLSNVDTKKYAYIHKLVMEQFAPFHSLEKYQVNHIDGDKHNNYIGNLEWCTPSENGLHAYKIGLQKHPKGELHGGSILKEEDVYNILKLFHVDCLSTREICKLYPVKRGTVLGITGRYLWPHLEIPKEWEDPDFRNRFKIEKVKEILRWYYVEKKPRKEIYKLSSLPFTAIHSILAKRCWTHIPIPTS